MIEIRKSSERGQANHGWLQTRHTFSFADYHDPRHMNFRSLRVINEDFVAPAMGFDTHPHRDMEIITYIVSGVLRHKDSMGNTEMIRAGDVQRISAGTGITHSEFNGSMREPVHLLQIWLVPNRIGVKPEYAERSMAAMEPGKLHLVVSGTGRDGALSIHQDAEVYVAKLNAGQSVEHPIKRGRNAWLQLIKGELDAGGVAMNTGDGIAVSKIDSLKITPVQPAHFLLFDLA